MNRNVDVAGAMSYQNPALVARFARKQGLPLQDAERHFEEARKFLVICALMRDPCTPSEVLDEIWHHFVLHTRDYAEFCDRYLGGFIHHVPTDTRSAIPSEEMFRLAEQTFGTPVDPNIWSSSATCEACNGQGGGCSDGL